MLIESITTDSGHSGYVVNMPREQYRTIPRLNPSSLAAGLLGVREVDPRAIRDAFQSEDRNRTGAAQDRMDRGTLAHLALLQPDRLADSVAVWGGGRRYGAKWGEFNEEHAGKLIITADDNASTMAVVKQIAQQRIVSMLLCDTESEVAMFAVEDGIHCKGQVDAVNIAGRVIVDLKTTEAGIDSKSVERTVRQFHYREKMALYRRWLARATNTAADEWRCWNLFVGIGSTVGIRACKFTTESLEWGEMRMESAIAEVAKCLRLKSWPMFQVDDVITVAPWEIEETEELCEVSYE